MSTSYTYRIKGARWLRRYDAPAPTPVYAAMSDAQTVADTMCDVPWTRASSDGPAMFPQHNSAALDANVGNRDLFDAALFCSDHKDGAHVVHANAACYLFALPSAARGKTLESVKVHLSSDPYNANGARVAVHLLASATIPTDCATVRTGAAHAEGAMPRTGTDYWYAASGDVTIEMPTSTNTTAYLAIVVALENYATSRGEWLEGSSFIRNAVEITLSSSVEGWTEGVLIDLSHDNDATTLLSGGASPTWLQPLPTQNATDTAPTVSASAETIDTFFTTATPSKTPIAGTFTVRGTVVPNALTTNGMPVDTRIDFEAVFSLLGTDANALSGSVTSVVTEDGVGTTYGPSNMVLLDNGSGANVWGYVLPHRFVTNVSGSTTYYGYLHIYIDGQFSFHEVSDGAVSVSVPCKWFVQTSTTTTGTHSTPSYSRYSGTTGNQSSQSIGSYNYYGGTVSETVQLYSQESVYWMLRMAGGVPAEMDACRAPSESSRRNLQSTVTGSGSPWTVAVGGKSFTVSVSGNAVTLSCAADSQSWSFTLSEETTGQSYFDPAASIHIANDAVRDYGLAAALGDFSSAIATFEAGTQPSHAELLGRLVRNSRRPAGAMMYLHPKHKALAEELDVMRPVPRFFRVGSAGTSETSQTSCQPGLSAWFKRGFSTGGGTTSLVGSTAALGIVQRSSPEWTSVVTNPAFLQCALLAVRAATAAEAGARLVLKNTSTENAVHNGFALRFAVWASPANEWDGGNAFALAAMGSMPSVYRCDGEGEVSWQVDCSGLLMPFGSRTVTARRIGVSPLVSGDIAAEAEIAIPLSGTFGEGDVILIAPVVEGFADGTGAVSAYFGRQSDPATETTGWARYASDLGWFPEVKLLT